MNASLAASYAYCRRVARHRARNFYYAFLLLDRQRHDALCALYAFNRHCDDLVDEPWRCGCTPPSEALDKWERDLRQALRGQENAHPLWPALRDTVERYSIPVDYLFAVIEGVRSDLTPHLFPKFSDLYDYCRKVASAVGQSLIYVFGFQDLQALELAEKCGVAFQLTNILRDLAEDARNGRCYLPLEDLDRFGLTPASLLAAHSTPALEELLAFEIGRAWGYYRAAQPLVNLISPECRPALGALIAIYSELLRRIEITGSGILRERVTVPWTTKLSILARQLLSARAHP